MGMHAAAAGLERAGKGPAMTSIYDFSAARPDGSAVPLSDYRGKVMLIVNTASRCGFTPQYEGLERLYRNLQDRGLVVLGFPCNQFGKQEPGSADEIASFCSLNYGVTFPLFAKIDVNGPEASAVYAFLKAGNPDEEGNEDIAWNFTKFLVGRDGQVIRRFGPQVTPEEIASVVSEHL